MWEQTTVIAEARWPSWRGVAAAAVGWFVIALAVGLVIGRCMRDPFE